MPFSVLISLILALVVVVPLVVARLRREGETGSRSGCKEGFDWTAAAVANHRDGLFVCSGIDGLKLSVREANDAFWALVGGAENSGTISLQAPHTDERDLARLDSAIRDAQSIAIDLPIRRLDGREFIAELWLKPLHHVGAVEWLGTIRDVTEARRVEQEIHLYARDLKQRTQDLSAEIASTRAADEAKGRFLANVSHEIRNPMSAVIATTELLLMTGLDAEPRDYAVALCNAGNNLIALLNDVLDLSRMEEGQLRLTQTPFPLRGMVDDAVSLLALQGRAKGVVVTTEISSSTPRMVMGDPVRLKQVLHNLVSNALKFTEEGEVRVVVAPDGQQPGGRIRFEVSDSGVGIAESERELLFTRFSQVDSSLTSKSGGSGLGLVICQQIVTLMGGTIGFESRQGSGSTFWFAVDLAAVPETAPAEKVIVEESFQEAKRAARILVVEDNDVNRRVALRLLEKSGFQVNAVRDGRAAVEEVIRNPYDIVLMDVQMPEMNGLDATRAIRALDSAVREVPVIAMTANAMSGDRERCLNAGMNDYVTKPVNAALLRATIDRWLSESTLSNASG